jgi:hypothetical protein
MMPVMSINSTNQNNTGNNNSNSNSLGASSMGNVPGSSNVAPCVLGPRNFYLKFKIEKDELTFHYYNF